MLICEQTGPHVFPVKPGPDGPRSTAWRLPSAWCLQLKRKLRAASLENLPLCMLTAFSFCQEEDRAGSLGSCHMAAWFDTRQVNERRRESLSLPLTWPSARGSGPRVPLWCWGGGRWGLVPWWGWCTPVGGLAVAEFCRCEPPAPKHHSAG